MKPKSPADKLKVLEKTFTKAKKGFRLTKYEVFQQTMEQAIILRSDADELEKFVQKADIDPEKLQTCDKSWIAIAAFTYVTHSEGLGWKGARAAEFLHDFKKVPVGELAKQMQKLGGIEKIVKLAAKEDPRQANPAAKKEGKAKSASKKSAIKLENVKKKRSDDTTDEWVDPIDDDDDERSELQILVRVTPKLRDKITGTKAKKRIKLICNRIADWSDVVLEATEVRRLKD